MNKKFNILIVIISIIVIISFTIINRIKIKENEKFEAEWKETEKIARQNNEMINEFLEKNKKNELISDEPYVPDGYEFIEGDIDTGYCIQDQNGNQYVWVPCNLTGENGKTILKKYEYNVQDTTELEYCLETDENLEKFIESVSKYSGFYIARFEAGKENEKLVFKKDKEIYNNVKKQDVLNLIQDINEKNEIQISLVNSLAWDTCIKWIEKDNKNFGTYSGREKELKIQKTGTYSINNIFDIDCNGWEMTTETCDGLVIYRGGQNLERDIEAGYRGLLFDEPNPSLTFRTILYKL